MANTSGAVRAADEQPGRIPRHELTITNDTRLRLRGRAISVDLTLFIGSRRMGRSFAYESGGHVFQAPAGYYANRGIWDSPPGYEHDRAPDFSRPITSECLFCHATRSRVAPESVNRFAEIVHGIQCERCHGGGAAHDRLLNPPELAPRLRDSVCEQCHLNGAVRLVRSGRKLEDFRVGENLADYLEVLLMPEASREVRVNGHSEALALSRCKRAAGDRLWCGTCHNPHRAANYNAVCQSCHTKPHRTGDCVSCHMKKSRAVDGGHTVFTDHTILPARPPATLVSYFGRTLTPRDLGLGFAQLGAQRRDPTLLAKAWPLLRRAAGPKPHDPLLYATIASLLQADGRKDQAIAYYRLSLRQDPIQPDTLGKLAALLGDSEEARRLRARSAQLLGVGHGSGME